MQIQEFSYSPDFIATATPPSVLIRHRWSSNGSKCLVEATGVSVSVTGLSKSHRPAGRCDINSITTAKLATAASELIAYAITVRTMNTNQFPLTSGRECSTLIKVWGPNLNRSVGQ